MFRNTANLINLIVLFKLKPCHFIEKSLFSTNTET